MRTQFRLKSILGSTAIAVSLFMAPCNAAGNQSALEGKWVGVYGDKKDVVMELLSDGTGTLSKGSEKVKITWKAEKGRFHITASDAESVSSYKQKGSSLTFTDDKGEISLEYAKCNTDCKEASKEYVKAMFAGAKKGSFTDSREGKSYKTLKFGNQTWMAENLNYKAKDSKCYANEESNCKKYGRLYDWNTASKACPKGWRLPNDRDWVNLTDLAGGDRAGYILKASSGWESDGNGIDSVGFSALPGGSGNSSGVFVDGGRNGTWWSATENTMSAGADGWFMGYGIVAVLRGVYDYTSLFSVRCIKN